MLVEVFLFRNTLLTLSLCVHPPSLPYFSPSSLLHSLSLPELQMKTFLSHSDLWLDIVLVTTRSHLLTLYISLSAHGDIGLR